MLNTIKIKRYCISNEFIKFMNMNCDKFDGDDRFIITNDRITIAVRLYNTIIFNICYKTNDCIDSILCFFNDNDINVKYVIYHSILISKPSQQNILVNQTLFENLKYEYRELVVN